MKAKSNVKHILISFYNMILKAIRLDNAPEFSLLEFFSAYGIIHQKSCAMV